MATTNAKLDVYLDFLFIKKFFENEPSETKTPQYRVWLDFYFFLKSNHIRVFNPKDNLTTPNADFIRLFEIFENLEKRNNLFSKMDFSFEKYHINTNYDYSKIQNPHSVFFIEFSETQSQDLEKKHGYFFINSENFVSKWKLLNPRNYQSFKTVSEKGDFKTWKDFARLKHPANAILIVDRYIFGGNYQHNLQEMFENLFETIAEKSQILLIIGNSINNKPTDLKNETELKKQWSKIVKQKWTQAENSVAQVFEKQGEKRTETSLTHDRRIVTNYFYLVSGDSYSYVNKNQENLTNTDFHIYTVFDSETFTKMQERLLEFRKVILKPDNSCRIHFNNREGDCQNRLLA